eukprot:g6810.t1
MTITAKAVDDERLSLEWDRLTYTIPDPIAKKKASGKGAPVPATAQEKEPPVAVTETAPTRNILGNVSGRALPGQLTAIMGPSGSGKTSLLNALAGRVPLSPGATLSGTVRVNGASVDNSTLSALSAYVEQDDVLFALSTVFETLLFAAQLRLPSSVPLAEKKKRVERVIAELGLGAARDTLIGNEQTRGVSGGERKRVNVGTCMLHDPRLVFVDEPTSGLDAFQALNVMSTLKALCEKSGRTVVVSIHQPRSSIYAMLDSLLLLAQGRVVYAGGAGAPCSAHFARLGEPVPADFNPADHFLDVSSVDQRSPELQRATQKRVDMLVGAFADGESAEAVEAGAKQGGAAGALVVAQQAGRVDGGGGGGGGGATPPRPQPHVHSRFRAFSLLLERNWKEQTRDKTALVLKYFMGLFFSVIFGLVYFQLPRNQVSIQDRSGILFFMAMNQAFGSVIGCSQVIPVQLKVVNRERAANLYEVFPFYAAAFAVNLPLEVVPQFVNGSIVYFMANMRPG